LLSFRTPEKQYRGICVPASTFFSVRRSRDVPLSEARAA
jgi:hypothetical protein